MKTLFDRLTFLAFSSNFTVMLPVPGPTSRTTSVGLKAAWTRPQPWLRNTVHHDCLCTVFIYRMLVCVCQKPYINLSIPECTRTAYLLNDPIDNQWILQDVLTDAGVKHDPCNRGDTLYWACVMLTRNLC